MPRADDQSNSYIWAAEALTLLGPAYGSTAAAERVLLRNAPRMPWTWTDVDPPGAPAEETWQQLTYTLKPRLAQNVVEFLSIEFGIVTVSGIKFGLSAVEALLPAGHAAAATAAPAAWPQMPKASCKMWLKHHAPQRRKDETAEAYHERLRVESGGKWTPEHIANMLSKLHTETKSTAPLPQKSQK